jgi:hypothetical protein
MPNNIRTAAGGIIAERTCNDAGCLHKHAAMDCALLCAAGIKEASFL